MITKKLDLDGHLESLVSFFRREKSVVLEKKSIEKP